MHALAIALVIFAIGLIIVAAFWAYAAWSVLDHAREVIARAADTISKERDR